MLSNQTVSSLLLAACIATVIVQKCANMYKELRNDYNTTYIPHAASYCYSKNLRFSAVPVQP